ncbi:MAG TPA: electron transport complex subunit RsxC [Phycisphaerae bacterium]|nr:electron transport complex subunit RsxC [Phycisphaerae bacterium]
MIAGLLDRMKGLKSFPRGVHPPHRKKYSESAPIGLFAPMQDLLLPFVQHIGVACDPLVQPKQKVAYAEKIGDAASPMAAPIHAPLAGEVGTGTMAALPSGRRVPAIPLKPAAPGEQLPPDFLRQFLDRRWDGVEPNGYEPDEICAKIREGGVVGMGGATFPTHFKLKKNPDRPIDTVIINGCECEPYLTSDHRLMLEAPEPIVVGLQLAMRACGADRGIIAVEANKPDAIEALRGAARGRPGIEVVVCATKYPMGGERQLIPAVLGRTVPSAPQGLPPDVGVVMVNVATAHSIARAVIRGIPLTHRVVTVTGAGVNEPGNWLVPFGTRFGDLLGNVGGLKDAALKVVAGGPMMGPTVPNLDVTVVKGTSGITVMTEPETAHWQESPCIRCSRCVDNCPLHLSPTKIAHAVKFRDYDLAQRFDMTACCECGCCSFVCPANIPLAQYIRAGKNQLRMMAARKQEFAK